MDELYILLLQNEWMNEFIRNNEKTLNEKASLRSVKAKIIEELALHLLSDGMHWSGFYLLFCSGEWADDEAYLLQSTKHSE